MRAVERFCRRWKYTMLAVVLLAFGLFGLFRLASAGMACENSGGSYMRDYAGRWKCIHER
jgi:hypothetical protein